MVLIHERLGYFYVDVSIGTDSLSFVLLSFLFFFSTHLLVGFRCPLLVRYTNIQNDIWGFLLRLFISFVCLVAGRFSSVFKRSHRLRLLLPSPSSVIGCAKTVKEEKDGKNLRDSHVTEKGTKKKKGKEKKKILERHTRRV